MNNQSQLSKLAESLWLPMYPMPKGLSHTLFIQTSFRKLALQLKTKSAAMNPTGWVTWISSSLSSRRIMVFNLSWSSSPIWDPCFFITYFCGFFLVLLAAINSIILFFNMFSIQIGYMIYTWCHIRWNLKYYWTNWRMWVASSSTRCDTILVFMISSCWELGINIKASSNVTYLHNTNFLFLLSHNLYPFKFLLILKNTNSFVPASNLFSLIRK